jgi:hypothetical protein|tara:strand:- start:1193 stop:1609 length:417 start_codon:yes stop_codon:yes gene_type:complete
MATVIYTDAKFFLGGYNLSADHNQIGLDYSSEMLDVTTMGDSTRIHAGGLDTATVNGTGFWNGGSGNADEALFGLIGEPNYRPEYAQKVLTLFPDGIVEGTSTLKGYAMKSVLANYNIGNTVGDMLTFDLTAESAGTD